MINRKRYSRDVFREGRKFPAPLNRLIDRNRNGRTDCEIIESAGYSRTMMSFIRSGKLTDIKLSVLLDILDALDIGLAEYAKEETREA